MAKRRERFEARAQKKRELVWTVMERANIKKIAVADFTAGLRTGKSSVVVTDESTIPPVYWIKQQPKLDRINLYKALCNGAVVIGATLANAPPTLTVRTK